MKDEFGWLLLGLPGRVFVGIRGEGFLLVGVWGERGGEWGLDEGIVRDKSNGIVYISKYVIPRSFCFLIYSGFF